MTILRRKTQASADTFLAKAHSSKGLPPQPKEAVILLFSIMDIFI